MSTTYGFTNKYLTKDGKPWFPVMGEIHFSRYRADLSTPPLAPIPFPSQIVLPTLGSGEGDLLVADLA